MSFLEIELEAKALSSRERAALVTTLLETFPSQLAGVSDEEVARRYQELETGNAAAISQAEFVRLVERERGR